MPREQWSLLTLSLALPSLETSLVSLRSCSWRCLWNPFTGFISVVIYLNWCHNSKCCSVQSMSEVPGTIICTHTMMSRQALMARQGGVCKVYARLMADLDQATLVIVCGLPTYGRKKSSSLNATSNHKGPSLACWCTWGTSDIAVLQYQQEGLLPAPSAPRRPISPWAAAVWPCGARPPGP